MRKYIEIAKTAYCTEGDQWDCRDCELVNILKEHHFDPSYCRKELIIGMVKELERGGDANE